MYFYDSQLGMKIGNCSDDNEPEGRVALPYMAVIVNPVFEFSYSSITDKLVGATFNRIKSRPGTAFDINRVSLVNGDIRSLSKNRVYITTGEFFPYVQYLIKEGYQIYNIDAPFYSGFKPGGKFRGAIVSRPTMYKISKLENGRFVMQTINSDSNGSYINKGGAYSSYSKNNRLAGLSDLKLESLF